MFGIKNVKGKDEGLSLGGWHSESERRMDKNTLKKVYKEMAGTLYHLLQVDQKYSGWEEYSLLTLYCLS